MSDQIKKIGFIGTGIMGGAMAQHLLDEGYEMQVYNRTKEKADQLVAGGAVWKDTPAACAEGMDAVISMVGYPKDVEEIYLGQDGILAGARPGAYVADMTTSSPALAVQIAEEAAKKGIHALDAPVTGGDIGAKAGTLTILVGGSQADFSAMAKVFCCMGTNVNLCGGPGAGQHMKMANQIAVAGALAGACEAISYAKAAGLDVEKMIEMVGTGAGGSFQLTKVASRGAGGDFDPGFMLKHFVKDLNLANEAGQANGLTLDITARIRDIASGLEKDGLGTEGTQALLKHYMK